MTTLEAFLAKDSLELTENIVVSDRFCENGEAVKWCIRRITEAENRELRRAVPCNTNGTGMDYDAYLLKLASTCTVYPDLKNAALQKAYGVLGEGALLQAMLLPGEYAVLLSAIKRINGFDEPCSKTVASAKKS